MAGTKINSSAISFIDYDEKTQTLTVAFVKGGTWQASGVDPQYVTGLRNAISKGTYWNIALRYSFAFKRIG